MRETTEIRRYKKTLQTLMTEGLHKRIKDLGLVSSGKMLNTTKAKVSLRNGELSIGVESTDYFSYLDAEYNIINYVIDTNAVSNALSDLVGEIAVEKMFRN